MRSDVCEACEVHGLGMERVRYYSRQLITAEDMTTEQEYFRQKLRRHNRHLHGWGVSCGLEVKPNPQEGKPWQVRVCPGYAASCGGDEIFVCGPIDFDLATGAQRPADPCADRWPCPPGGRMPAPDGEKCIYLAIRYAECDARPERIHPSGCGCDEAACEYSRIRDAFELKALWELPESHEQAKAWDAAWTAKAKAWKAAVGSVDVPGAVGRTFPAAPVPACPPCADPWVVLACVVLPAKEGEPIVDSQIHYDDRRVLYSVHALHLLLTA